MTVARHDGASSLNRFIAAIAVLAPAAMDLVGCGPSYSPDTYSTNAVQQANKVDPGVIIGVRPVAISAQGTVGGVAGAAAGGIAGSQVGAGTTSAFAAIGGSLIGGIAGVTAEHVVGDTNGFEYIVRKANGDMVSVAQKDPKPLPVGQKVLVISGAQARIVPDYTVPADGPAKAEANAAPEARPASPSGSEPASPPSGPVSSPPQSAGAPAPIAPPVAIAPSVAVPPPVSVPSATAAPGVPSVVVDPLQVPAAFGASPKPPALAQP
jgi:outer membrane lipoprotein SlyB